MFIKDWKKDVFTIPNLLSLFRLLLIPVYVSIYLEADSYPEFLLAAAILTVSCLTDLIDGWIARRFHMISTLGKILDPVADKLTQFSLMSCLCAKHPQIIPVLCLFVVKESFQCIIGLLYLRKGRMLPGALPAGKICTAVLFLSLIALVLLPDLNHQTVSVIAMADALFLGHSFVHYFLAYFGAQTIVQDIGE